MTTGLAISERKRRSFSKAFKAQVVGECLAGASTASVALAHGLNTNMVWKWVRRAQASSALAVRPAFIPVVSPVAVKPTLPQSSQAIEIELQRGDMRIVVRWPVGQAEACTVWLRDLLR